MGEAAELGNDLPLSFKSRREQESIAFLGDAFETNYTHGTNQFPFLAYPKLTMSCGYFSVWQIKQTGPGDFETGLIGFGKDVEKNLLEAPSPFVCRTVNERSIPHYVQPIAWDNGRIGIYARRVDDRNQTARPNSNLFYSTQAPLGAKITAILRVVDEIRTHSRPVIAHCCREILLQNHDPKEREYPLAADQIREAFIHRNYLSQRDIDACTAFDIEHLKDRRGIEGIRTLHPALKKNDETYFSTTAA